MWDWIPDEVRAKLGDATVVQVAGRLTRAALLSDGRVVCWGYNGWDQCELPSDLGPCKAVDVGGDHTVALTEDGRIVCWGYDDEGQGDVPADLGPCKAIAAGGQHTVALTEDGRVVCWGRNYEGQCDVPANLGPCKAIAAGSHTVALTEDGRVVCWGDNDVGQCDVPAGLGPCKAIAAGNSHTVALTEDGRVVCWGKDDCRQCRVPADIGQVMAIYAISDGTAARTVDGETRFWGHSCSLPPWAIPDDHALSILLHAGRHIDRDAGEALAARLPRGAWRMTARGSCHSAAVLSDGRVVCWGDNDQCDVPANLGPCKAIAAGGQHTVALTEDGRVAIWGDGGSRQRVPAELVQVAPIGWRRCLIVLAARLIGPRAMDRRRAKAVAAGDSHTVALTVDGRVVCWGRNHGGQCNTPADLGPCTAVAACHHHTVALTEGGRIVCWGLHVGGRCDIPTAIQGSCIGICARWDSSFALDREGKLHRWGTLHRWPFTEPDYDAPSSELVATMTDDAWLDFAAREYTRVDERVFPERIRALAQFDVIRTMHRL